MQHKFYRQASALYMSGKRFGLLVDANGTEYTGFIDYNPKRDIYLVTAKVNNRVAKLRVFPDRNTRCFMVGDREQKDLLKEINRRGKLD